MSEKPLVGVIITDQAYARKTRRYIQRRKTRRNEILREQ